MRARRGSTTRFDRLAADDFESLPWDQFRLAALARAGTAAAELRDTRSAAVLEAILEPYHEQLLVLPACCIVFDAADGLRGDLLTLLERLDEAVACLEAATALCKRARIVPHSIRTRAPTRSGTRVTKRPRGPRESARTR